MPQDTPKAKRAKAPDAEIDAFAHHFAEALRIARTSDLFSARFYNGLADAWCDFENDIRNAQSIHDSEEFIRLALLHRAEHGGNDWGGGAK